jgi:hypothetical protein
MIDVSEMPIFILLLVEMKFKLDFYNRNVVKQETECFGPFSQFYGDAMADRLTLCDHFMCIKLCLSIIMAIGLILQNKKMKLTTTALSISFVIEGRIRSA